MKRKTIIQKCYTSNTQYIWGLYKH